MANPEADDALISPPPPPSPSVLRNKDFRSHLGIGTTQKAATH